MLKGTQENFKELISEGVSLVDFNADWGVPCQMMKPVVEELAEKVSEVKFISVNVDDEEELSEEYEVSTIPCLVLLKDGKEVAREVGVISPKKLEKMVRR